MATTHSHACKHCDSTWYCKNNACEFPREVDKWHDCHERELYSRRMARLLSDYVQCKYKCRSLPCVHNKWPDKPAKRASNNFARVKPGMVVDERGVWRVVCEANAHSMASELATELERIGGSI